jgi:polyketide cyclase/dehydrase/lipid transport protein
VSATHIHCGVLVTALLASTAVRAAEILRLDVERDGGCYRLFSITHIDAEPEAVFARLTDYDDFERVSSAYKESHYVASNTGGAPIVYTRIEGCVVFFCRSVSRVERLETEAPRVIRATAVPERSDVAYSRSEWILEPEGGGTRVTYSLTIRPNFWIPPLLGPWMLRKGLLKDAELAANRVEDLAGRGAVHAHR